MRHVAVPFSESLDWALMRINYEGEQMKERELELLARIEELERHTWRNSAILRAVAMVAFTALIGIVVASGVVGGGKGSHWSGPAWNTMWLYGLFAANAVSMFWTTHKE